jgi:hypothetical protein
MALWQPPKRAPVIIRSEISKAIWFDLMGESSVMPHFTNDFEIDNSIGSNPSVRNHLVRCHGMMPSHSFPIDDRNPLLPITNTQDNIRIGVGLNDLARRISSLRLGGEFPQQAPLMIILDHSQPPADHVNPSHGCMRYSSGDRSPSGH